MKMKIGFVACGLVILHFLVNLILMFCGSCKNLVRSIKLNAFNRKLSKQRRKWKAGVASRRAFRKKQRSKMLKQLEEEKNHKESSMESFSSSSSSQHSSSSSITNSSNSSSSSIDEYLVQEQTQLSIKPKSVEIDPEEEKIPKVVYKVEAAQD